jgi:WhiB family redox-sensing transcriptional regulator
MTWREWARCKGVDLELFFTPERESTAREWCDACPVRDACLADAFRCHDLYGFRSGMTAAERKKYLPKRKAGKAVAA